MAATLPTALQALGAYRQFILWRRADKLPCSYTTGQPCDPHAPANWTDAATAFVTAAANPTYGVGFVLTAADPFFVADVDSCLQSDGTWSKAALDMVAAFPGAAVEVSQSGKGLHIWGSYRDIPAHSCKRSGYELYHDGRYIALGHPNATGNVATDCTSALGAAVARWFTPTVADATPADWTDTPCSEWRGTEDDDALIERMLRSKQSVAVTFGGRASFADLWTGNTEALARSYPSTTPGQPYDASSADQALAMHLSFWTGKNCARIERLMRRSALVRDKWERDDYLRARTIPRAVANTANVCQDKQPDLPVSRAETPAQPETPADPLDAPTATPAKPAPATSRRVNGTTFASPDAQALMWAGFAYVVEDNKILTDTGEMLDEARFKAKYGGLSYAKDNTNDKFTENAWEAFIMSKALRHPKVDRTAFRPDLPPFTIYEEDNLSFINTYIPPKVARKKGDASPLLRHLEKLLPVPRDREIVLAYMAALVQYQGHKFNWCIFLQGTHGNGKSLLSLCVKAAIGDRYSHMPRADGLTENFNDWLARSTFCGVEDIYLPSGREEILEILKPMITLDYQPIRAMQRSQTMKRVCCNFILNSNHKDGIRKTREDRRFASFFCAQQEVDDLARDGLTSDYFADLYDWLYHKGGFAIVSEFLHTYKIPKEFSLPHLKSRAPTTSSTEEAITLSLGRVEQEVMEAVAQHRNGFCGGWINSMELDALLKEKRMDVTMTRAKRLDMVRSLGYDWHPALYKGRSTTAIGQARPILFIKRGHIAREVKDQAQVAQVYLKAQAEGGAGYVPAFGQQVRT